MVLASCFWRGTCDWHDVLPGFQTVYLVCQVFMELAGMLTWLLGLFVVA
jgi:hypothetical protein